MFFHAASGSEMRFPVGAPWRERLLKTIQTNYGRAPHYAEVFRFLDPLIRRPTDNLAE